ncbi:MAG: hypothetical protein IPM35_38130 [Myxococcales bacterium]|nr:hypothetical protein [Myxococcales bacterium]
MSVRSWGLALVVLPVVTATALVGPGMVSRADGCSGAPGNLGTGWNGLSGLDDTAAPTTGVVALQGTLKGLSESDALGAVTVSVEDSAALPVAGALSLHDLGPAPYDTSQQARQVLVVWKPDAPLEPNAQYQVSWSVADAALGSKSMASSGDLGVTTLSSPASPAGVLVSQSAFRRERRLVGETVSCEHDGSLGCGYTKLHFGSTEVQVPVVDITFAPAEASHSRYQITRVEPVPGKGVLASAPSAFVNLPPSSEYPHSVTLEFADDVPEYCVRLVTEDLTSDKKSTSPDVCVARNDAEAPGPSLLGQHLLSCKAPPTPELEGAWCDSHPDAAQCESAGGCSLAPTNTSQGWALAGVLVLGLGALARRRASSPGRGRRPR